MKRVTFEKKPQGNDIQAERWVNAREVPKSKPPLKRLTIDIPEELHRRLKAKAAQNGTTIRDIAEDFFRGYCEKA